MDVVAVVFSFQFAQRKRRETYGEPNQLSHIAISDAALSNNSSLFQGDEKPWGILGLYDHLGEYLRAVFSVTRFLWSKVL